MKETTKKKKFILLDPSKLAYLEKVNTEKKRILEEAAKNEDKSILADRRKFDESSLIDPDCDISAAIQEETREDEMLFNTLMIGKAAGREAAKSELQRERGKKGGQKSGIRGPILAAAIEFTVSRTEKSNETIAHLFSKKHRESNPLRVMFGNAQWEVYHYAEVVFARPDTKDSKKRNNQEISIKYSTFRTKYISRAKKAITSRNQA